MIPRIHDAGRSFLNAIRYVCHDARDPAAEPGTPHPTTANRVGLMHIENLGTDDPEMAARIMASTVRDAPALKIAAGLGTRGRKPGPPVYHCSLSWEPGETPDHSTKIAAGRKVLKVVGLENHEAVFAEHVDTDHRHLHIVASRVCPTTGRTVNTGRDKLKLSQWAETWERDHGRIRVPNRVARAKVRSQNAEERRAASAEGRPARLQPLPPMEPRRRRRADGTPEPPTKMETCAWAALYRRQEDERDKDSNPELDTTHGQQRAELARDCREVSRLRRELPPQAIALADGYGDRAVDSPPPLPRLGTENLAAEKISGLRRNLPPAMVALADRYGDRAIESPPPLPRLGTEELAAEKISGLRRSLPPAMIALADGYGDRAIESPPPLPRLGTEELAAMRERRCPQPVAPQRPAAPRPQAETPAADFQQRQASAKAHRRMFENLRQGWSGDESEIPAAAATLAGEYPQLAGLWGTLSERQAKHVATDPHAERYELLETIDGNLFQAGEARRTMELNVIATVAEKAPTATPGTPSRLGLLIERAFARLQELVDAIIDRALGRDRPAKQVVETPAVETSPPRRAPGTSSIPEPLAVVRGKGQPTGGEPPPRADRPETEPRQETWIVTS